MDTTTIIFILTTIGGFAWGLLTRWNLLDSVDLGNEKLNAIVDGSRKTAIATDYYIRSMADGTLTIEEGQEFKNKAADAIISQLNLIEEVTGKQIYNHASVPLPLPVGGQRAVEVLPMDNGQVVIEQPVQPVNPEGA